MTPTRARVAFPKDWTFDLAEDLIDGIRDEFDPDDAVGELAPRVAGKPVDEAEEAALQFFTDYGRRWMDRTLELGEKYTDRAYETLKKAAERTGELAFPFIPERFIEIAYLATQPIYSLPIAENTVNTFSYKMVFCDTITALREQCGDELADRLPCRAGCLTAAGRAFTSKGFDVVVSQDSRLSDGEFCQFTVRRKHA
ncbi:MAG: hypothetical protein C0506_14065 [Anaerolinea sp.]|nr:hypothetical protein [Anaerolinea sp.]